jgi:hypothetical protein
MTKTIPEILQLINMQSTKQERIDTIRANNSEILEIILQYALAEHIEFDLPPGEVPYKRDTDIPVGMGQSNLFIESKRLYIFLKGQATNLPAMRKEMLFIQMLEGLHALEADIVIAIKNKTLTDMYPNITYELVYEAIPTLLPPNTRVQIKPEVKPEPIVEEPIVEKEQVNMSEGNLEHVKPGVMFRVFKDGTRIRVKKDTLTPWPRVGPPKKVKQ